MEDKKKETNIRLSRYNLGSSNTRPWVVIGLVAIAKVFRSVGVLVSSSLLHKENIPVLFYCEVLLLGTALVMYLLQQSQVNPSKKAQHSSYAPVILSGILLVASTVTWHVGLKYFGPLKTIALAEGGGLLLLRLLPVLVGGLSPAKSKAAMFVILAYFILFWSAFASPHNMSGSLLEHMNVVNPTGPPLEAVLAAAAAATEVGGGGLASSSAAGAASPGKLSHPLGGRFLLVDDVVQLDAAEAMWKIALPFNISKEAIEQAKLANLPVDSVVAFDHSFFGLSEGVFGYALLMISLLFSVLHTQVASKSAHKVGGMKHLHWMSTVVGTVILFPAAVWEFVTWPDALHVSTLSWGVWAQFAIVILFASVFNFLSEILVAEKLEGGSSSRLGYAMTFATVYLFELYHHGAFHFHFLSLAAFALIYYAMGTLLTSSSHSDEEYLPSAIQASGPVPISVTVRAVAAEVWSDENSRKICTFLCINLSFMCVEVFYGYWTNSLTLISDAFHMLFDCTSLIIALYCSVVAKWPSTAKYSYGYGRYEVLSGFVNGVFLVFIALFILVEAIERLYTPPEMSTDRLMMVAVCGLCVNLFGMFAFSGHGHSHGGKKCEHSHGDGATMGMTGVYLHVMADTLGSVGVIISSLCISNFGWYSSDPIASIVISLLITGSVLPLLRDTIEVLLQRTPTSLEGYIGGALEAVAALDSVEDVCNVHVWQHTEELCVGSLVVRVKADASEQAVRNQVRALMQRAGVAIVTIQVEKQVYGGVNTATLNTVTVGNGLATPSGLPSGAGDGVGLLDSGSLLGSI